MPFFDPDRKWKNWDKVEHLLGGFFLCAMLSLVVSHFLAFVITVKLLAAFELGQWDTARNPVIRIASTNLSPLGQPGFGFGLLDLAAGTIGALLWLALT